MVKLMVKIWDWIEDIYFFPIYVLLTIGFIVSLINLLRNKETSSTVILEYDNLADQYCDYIENQIPEIFGHLVCISFYVWLFYVIFY